MSSPFDRGPLLRGTAVSLATLVGCALASDALASRPAADRNIGAGELSARVAAAAERIRLSVPDVERDLPPVTRISFTNR
jgi:hypothetical protein